MKNIVIALLLVSIILVAGCTSQTSDSTQQASMPSTPEQPEPDVAPPSNTIPSVSTTRAVKEFNMTAKQFEFVPSTIEVSRGDQVVLHITSTDVAHGFSLATFDIIENLPVGVTKTIIFNATESGEFNFFCSVWCGSGHADMRGKLIVNP